eukprot:scaffold6505_cov79-Isochrysis_galbana.AAC.3
MLAPCIYYWLGASAWEWDRPGVADAPASAWTGPPSAAASCAHSCRGRPSAETFPPPAACCTIGGCCGGAA